MNKTTSVLLYSLGTVVVFAAFFYFYNAAIFEAEIIANTGSVTADVALKAFFNYEALGGGINVHNVVNVVPTIKGILLMVVCLIGLPLMIGYRLATNQDKVKENIESKKD